jgi:Zn-dependent protease
LKQGDLSADKSGETASSGAMGEDVMNFRYVIMIFLALVMIFDLIFGDFPELIGLLFSHPDVFFPLMFLLLYSLIIARAAQVWVAHRFGDSTELGRLSLDLRKHFDLSGFLSLLIFRYGWVGPFSINYSNIKKIRKALVLIHGSGIAANLLIGLLSTMLWLHFWEYEFANLLLSQLAKTNIALAAVNIIPIPPFDGARILMGLAPRQGQNFFAQLQPYGVFVVVGLLCLGVLHELVNPFWSIFTDFVIVLIA